jgi:hypothetical protein
MVGFVASTAAPVLRAASRFGRPVRLHRLRNYNGKGRKQMRVPRAGSESGFRERVPRAGSEDGFEKAVPTIIGSEYTVAGTSIKIEDLHLDL